MKAILCKEPGAVDVLYFGEAPTPTVKRGEVLIEVRATALNRADIVQRKGFYNPPKGESEVLGLEVAGVIRQVGKDCTKFQEGDKVCALLAGGGYATQVAISESLCFPIPKGLSFEEATAIPEVFLTAHQALFWLGDLKENEYALIHAGGSGVGSAAIQLCQAVGAKAIATAGNAQKLTFCEELGALHAFDYHATHVAEEVLEATEGQGVNVILDFVAGAHYPLNLKVAGKDARWVVLGLLGGRFVDRFDFGKLLMKRIQLMGTTLRARDLEYKSQLCHDFTQRFLPLFETGELKPVIDQVIDWKEVKTAHAYMEANKNLGKIVMRVTE